MEFPDFFERAQKEQAVTHLPGITDLEAMTVLGATLLRNWPTKRELVEATLGTLNRPVSDKGIVLRLIDDLVRLHMLHRHDFRYEMTPSGRTYLLQTRARYLGAMRFLTDDCKIRALEY